VGEKAGRRRAVGTRDRVMSHLHMVGEVRDASGMASTALAEAIAYPGSSIAFAQLLSGMERSGLIEREVRGKRTYRITPLKAAVKPAPTRAGSSRAGSSRTEPSRTEPSRTDKPVPVGKSGGRAVAGETAAALDYDELARRLLLQVVQRLGASSGQGPEAVEDAGAGGPGDSGPGDSGASLARTVASLEHKLASATSKQRRLTQENAKLREQLRAAQESLAQERAGADRIAGRLDSAEVRLLERLLSPLRDKGARHEEADAG
jgi:hypothetical protein